jgi:hypothetical protein
VPSGAATPVDGPRFAPNSVSSAAGGTQRYSASAHRHGGKKTQNVFGRRMAEGLPLGLLRLQSLRDHRFAVPARPGILNLLIAQTRQAPQQQIGRQRVRQRFPTGHLHQGGQRPLADLIQHGRVAGIGKDLQSVQSPRAVYGQPEGLAPLISVLISEQKLDLRNSSKLR